MQTIILNLLLIYAAGAIFTMATPDPSSDVWANALNGVAVSATASNATLGLVLDASPRLNGSDVKITCLSTSRAYRPISMAEYYQAVQQILIRDDALEPHHFRLGPEGSARQDYHWQGEQCAIAFFSSQPLRTDAFPIILVAHVAALIADTCVTEAKSYLGGYARIGPNMGSVGVGNVNIAGVRSEER